MSDFVLDQFLPYQLAVLAARVSRDFSRVYKARYDIGVAEWRVVAHLSQTAEPVSVREICARVDMEKSKVSRAATRLQTRGFVDKVVSPADKRLVDLSLTPKGQAMIDDLAPLARQFEQDLLRQLGDGGAAFRQTIASLLGAPAH